MNQVKKEVFTNEINLIWQNTITEAVVLVDYNTNVIVDWTIDLVVNAGLAVTVLAMEGI